MIEAERYSKPYAQNTEFKKRDEVDIYFIIETVFLALAVLSAHGNRECALHKWLATIQLIKCGTAMKSTFDFNGKSSISIKIKCYFGVVSFPITLICIVRA